MLATLLTTWAASDSLKEDFGGASLTTTEVDAETARVSPVFILV